MDTTFSTAAKYSPVSGLITDTLGTPNGKGGYGGLPTPKFSPGTSTTASTAGAGAGAGAPPGPITTAGFTPDWKSLISNDPGLLNAQAALSAGSINDIASRNAAIQNAVVNFGSVPDVASLAAKLGLTEADVQSALGPDVQKLAQEATDSNVSTESRLSQANTDATRQIKNELNKRGLLNSSETGYQLNKQNTSYRQAEFDASSKLLDYLRQYQAGYASAEQARQSQLADQYSAAADRQFQSNQGSRGGATALFDHYDASGAAVYKGPDGQFYGADGSLYRAAAPAPPPPPAPPAPPVLGETRHLVAPGASQMA